MTPRTVERARLLHRPRVASIPKQSIFCMLQDAAGRVERCPGASCPFWERGGSLLDGACVLTRLDVDLPREPRLVDVLLEIRRRLACPGAHEPLDVARSHSHRLRSLFFLLPPPRS